MPRSLVTDGRMRARSRERVVREYRHYGAHFLLAIAGALLFFVGLALVSKIG